VYRVYVRQILRRCALHSGLFFRRSRRWSARRNLW
jgi:hypothetical protein